MSQLWFSRVANLIVGEHTDGLLQHIQHHNKLSARGPGRVAAVGRGGEQPGGPEKARVSPV